MLSRSVVRSRSRSRPPRAPLPAAPARRAPAEPRPPARCPAVDPAAAPRPPAPPRPLELPVAAPRPVAPPAPAALRDAGLPAAPVLRGAAEDADDPAERDSAPALPARPVAPMARTGVALRVPAGAGPRAEPGGRAPGPPAPPPA